MRARDRAGPSMVMREVLVFVHPWTMHVGAFELAMSQPWPLNGNNQPELKCCTIHGPRMLSICVAIHGQLIWL
jgi:hypothetical protein